MHRETLLFVNYPFARQLDMESPLFYGNALYQLKAYLEQCPGVAKAWDVKLVNFEGLDYLQCAYSDEDDLNFVEAVLAHAPRAVAFSLYVWNALPYAQLARTLKQLAPEVLLIVGGPETYDRPAFCQDFPVFDVVVEGDGEQPLEAVLLRLADGRHDLAGIANVSYRDHGDFHHNPAHLEPVDINAVPNFYAVHQDLVRGNGFYLTTRGCGYNCGYCLWARQSFRQKKPDKVCEELESLILEPALRQLILFDYDLLEIYREDRRLFDRIGHILAARSEAFALSMFTNPGFMAEPRLHELLKSLNLKRIILGLQSLNPEALRAVNRSWCLPHLSGLECVDRDLRTHFLVELVYPLPGETPESFVRTLKYLLEQGYFRLHVFNLMVFRGTALHRRSQALGLRFLNAPPYFCYETPTSSRSDTLRIGRLSWVLTLVADILGHLQPALPGPLHFPYGPETVDRILDHFRAGGHPDEIVRTIIKEVVGVDYPGGWCKREFKNAWPRHQPLLKVYRQAVEDRESRAARPVAATSENVGPALLPAADASKVGAGAMQRSATGPEFAHKDKFIDLFATLQLRLQGIEQDPEGVRFSLQGTDAAFQLVVAPSHSPRPFFLQTRLHKISYGGDRQGAQVAQHAAALLRDIEAAADP